MENEKLISVIVPIYNVDNFLEDCINSILNQTYRNLQVILINDGSIDNSGIICENYAKLDARITYISKENGGVSSARNVGIENAEGDYITFVDSDDRLELGLYSNVMNNIDDNDAFCFSYNVIDKVNNSITQKLNENMIIKEKDIIRNFSTSIIPCMCWLVVFKKDAVSNIRFKESNTMGEDILFVYTALRSIKSIKLGSYIGYNYMIHGNNAMSHINEKKALDLIDNMRDIINLENSFNSKERDLVHYFVISVIRNQLLINCELNTKAFMCLYEFYKGNVNKSLVFKKVSLKHKILLLMLLVAPKQTVKLIRGKVK